MAAVLAGEADEGADRGAYPPVALRPWQPRQHEEHRHRAAPRVPVRSDDPRGQVPVIEVDGEDGTLP